MSACFFHRLKTLEVKINDILLFFAVKAHCVLAHIMGSLIKSWSSSGPIRRLCDPMMTWHLIIPRSAPGLNTSGPSQGPPGQRHCQCQTWWMIQPEPRRHLSYRLQNVTSALGVLFPRVFRFASQRDERNKKRIVNKIVISRNIVDCLQWWYGSDSEKNRGRVWRLCRGSDKSFEQFSHNHCQISQMLSHPCQGSISHNWPVAWTRQREEKKWFPSAIGISCFRLGIWSRCLIFETPFPISLLKPQDRDETQA